MEKSGLHDVLARVFRSWGVEPMQSQGFLQSFGQTPPRARIQIHQFAMQPVRRLPGGSVVFQPAGRAVGLICVSIVPYILAVGRKERLQPTE